MNLRDFENGYCPAADAKLLDFHWSVTLQRQLRVWIDAGLLREDKAESASVLGLLYLTDAGYVAAGIAKPVPPIVETQRELF